MLLAGPGRAVAWAKAEAPDSSGLPMFFEILTRTEAESKRGQYD
jgi:hypothetical protein